MKTMIKSALLLICGLSLWASCADDRDSNPTIQRPTSFTMNTPAYATSEIDLATSNTLHFTWSQPEFGFPAKVDYQLQVSLTGNFTTSVDEAEADKSGTKVADYNELTSIYNLCEANANAVDFAKALQQLAHWAEDAVPAHQTVYVRTKAIYPNVDTVYSNHVQIKVAPYYIELKDAAPIIWYLIGSSIGDGLWSNSADGLGVSVIPMYAITGNTYDKKTGTGDIEYIGYFPAGAEFKILKTLGDWEHAICGVDGKPLETTVRNGEKSGDWKNITVATAGYYHISLNTATMKCTIQPHTGTVHTYTTITMPGTYQGWKETQNAMTAINTTVENHDWTTSVSFPADANSALKDPEGMKFANGSWAVNWGGEGFPYGTGIAGGANIPYKKGTYKVYFNDILGAYSFVAQ